MKKLILLFIFFSCFSTADSQSLKWAKTIGGTLGDVGRAIYTDSIDNLYVTGDFSGTVDLDPGPGTANFTSAGSEDIFILKLDSLGNFLWAKQISGSGIDNGLVIRVDNVGNIYVCGTYRGNIDLDPGPGTAMYTNLGSEDAFTIKLSNSGNYIWGRVFASSGIQKIEEMTIDSAGNCYYTGFIFNTVDFDPGAGVSNVYAGAMANIFILKLDSGGNFVWVKSIAGLYSCLGKSITIDNAGDIYLAGIFQDVCDFDPGPAVFNMTSAGSASDYFIAKFDDSGNFIWAKQFAGANGRITLDNYGNILATGNFAGVVDFDPGPGTYNLSCSGGTSNGDLFVFKLDNSGNFVWAVASSGPFDTEYSHAIHTDLFNNVYCTGYFGGTVDFDPGPGVLNVTASAGADDIFVLKLDPNGNLVFFKQIKGPAAKYPIQIIVNSAANIYLTGYFYGTTDFDPGYGTSISYCSGISDAFIVKLDHNTCSDMTVLFDSVYTNGCTSPGFIHAQTFFGIPPYSYTWNTSPPVNDSVIVTMSEGFYELVVTDSIGCISGNTLLMLGPVDSIAFDLQVNLIQSGIRAGLPTYYTIDAFNRRCTPVSGQVILVPDSTLIYISSTLPPDLISGDTLIWNFNNLTYDSAHIISTVKYMIPATSLGDAICAETIITPYVGDADTMNNKRSFCRTVIGSYDPNYKEVFPAGDCEPRYINNDQLLTYTVHFQNTGTADALNIFVLDTLDADLNINSVRVLSNSHPMITELLTGNVLKFRFDNIMLPDSTSDEQGSQGYFIFEVEPATGLINGTMIKNDVGIYFDFNDPVYTNTVFNTINDGTLFSPITTTFLSGITITSDQPGMLYQWIDCISGDSIAGANSQSYTPSLNGTYAVIISDGCAADTSACVQILTTGINELNNNLEFSIYPNPSQNTITISSAGETELFIFNLLGEIVLSSKVKNKSLVDTSSLKTGIYFIKNKSGHTIKFIKQ